MDKSHIIDTLVERAGLSFNDVVMGAHDPDFEAITEAMIQIHRGKEVLYGNYLKTHGSEPAKFSLIQHFCDTKRKYVRAENFIKLHSEDKAPSLEQLMDTYSDLAVYAIMGVQLVFHLMAREDKERAQKDVGSIEDEIPF